MTEPTVAAATALLVAVVAAVASWHLPRAIAALPERDPDDEATYAMVAGARGLRPALATVGAIIGGALGWARAGEPDVVAFAVLGVLGVGMGYVDLRRHLLPDRFTVPALVAGAVLLAAAAAAGGSPGWTGYARAWACAGGLLLVYLLMALVYPAGLGLGDVKLAGALGLHLGWLGWWGPVVGTFAAFVIGGLVGIVLLAAGRATRRTAVPFGPSMLIGALAAVLWGEQVTAWYLS
jgi:leader peptidase (prepilin peptidase)/N-methyltransferase